jgi:hypothetical protein
MTKYYPCPFNIITPGTSVRNLSSFPLITSDMLIEIIMSFPLGTALNFLYQFWLLPTAPSNNTVLPSGPEIVKDQIVPGYFAGDGVTYTIPFSKSIVAPNTVLCMAATNNTTGTLTAEAIAILSGPD